MPQSASERRVRRGKVTTRNRYSLQRTHKIIHSSNPGGHRTFRFPGDVFAAAETLSDFPLCFFDAFCSLANSALDFFNCATIFLNSSTCRLASSLAMPYFSWRIPTSCSCFPAMAASSSFISCPQWCTAFPLRCFHCPSTLSQFIVQSPFKSSAAGFLFGCYLHKNLR